MVRPFEIGVGATRFYQCFLPDCPMGCGLFQGNARLGEYEHPREISGISDEYPSLLTSPKVSRSRGSTSWKT